ncbi:related to nicotinamide mononucleotide permease [Cephalotrichum gorgonifer]|uniref:Related to nicotinamide mononucleotide permease n=1 Tax=Cephalotrichum gorgonifer TaxID=2041049 RepID=A0AAE8MQ51_9PEZI|nr:related to nicotinamide mononucleotide permease [Cephalotrichum gorgonifer]
MGFAWGEKKAGGDLPPEFVEGDADTERVGAINAPALDAGLNVECPPHTTEGKLVAKIDLHVIPFLCVMYLLAFLDRVNIANAKVFGLAKELNLDGTLYNNALVVFFVPYIIFEIPSNILLKRFKPHVWLSINMFLFGFVTMMQGLVQNYAGLVACRFFLGVFETGMFPGAFYLIGMWYRRHEAQRRYSFFFNSTTLAGAFGGLLAAAIGKMDGLRGYAGWRWIFILEGALTVFVSFFFYFLLPDFPEQVKWLTEEERTYVSARLRADQGSSAAERETTIRDVWNVLKDYRVIIGGFMYFGLIVPAYGYAYFAPGIIQGYGYSPIQTQLHSVPPWAAAFGFSMIVAYMSDKTRHRMGFALFAICVAIVGFGILIGVHDNTKLQYAALFLVAMGAYTAMPIIVCWFNMNLGGHHRRGVGSAWQVGFGNIGGIIAVYAFLEKDKPKFIPGYSISIAFTILSIISCIIYGISSVVENKKKARYAGTVELSEEEKTELGDKNPDYRYLL